MWEPGGTVIDRESIGPLEPEEILFEYAGEPLTYVASDPDGGLLLVHSLSVFDRTSRYLASAIDGRILADLKAGRIDIRTALTQSRCWAADVASDATIATLWRIEFGSLPQWVLPQAGAMLTPELEPLFRIRLMGEGVGPGKTSASDVRMAAEAAESSLRGLARIALAVKKSVGRPGRDVRYYSNLPYQFSRAASFELAFGPPQEARLMPQDDEVYGEMGALLVSGLATLRDDEGNPARLVHLDSGQKIELFKAIKALTPPMSGGVDQIEVGGNLLERLDRPAVLTRDDRRRIVGRIKAVRKPSGKDDLFLVTGVIEGADQGNLTFILRRLSPSTFPLAASSGELQFRFELNFYEDVMDAFFEQSRVNVIGVRNGAFIDTLGIIEADNIASLNSDGPGSG